MTFLFALRGLCKLIYIIYSSIINKNNSYIKIFKKSPINFLKEKASSTQALFQQNIHTIINIPVLKTIKRKKMMRLQTNVKLLLKML